MIQQNQNPQPQYEYNNINSYNSISQQTNITNHSTDSNSINSIISGSILYQTRPYLKTALKIESVVSVIFGILFFFSLYLFLSVVSKLDLSLSSIITMFVIIMIFAFLQPVITYIRLRNVSYIFDQEKIIFLPKKTFIYYANINDVSIGKKIKDTGDIIIHTNVGNFKLEKVLYVNQLQEYLKKIVSQFK